MASKKMNNEGLSFRDWLLNWRQLLAQGKFIPIAGLIIGILSFGVARFKNDKLITQLDEEYMTYFLVFINILILFFAVFTRVEYVQDVKYKNMAEEEMAKKFVRQNVANQKLFYNTIICFWITTLSLYLVLAYKYSKENTYRVVWTKYSKTAEANSKSVYDVNSSIANCCNWFHHQHQQFIHRTDTAKLFPEDEYYRPLIFEKLLEDSVVFFTHMDVYNKRYLDRIKRCSDSLFMLANNLAIKEPVSAYLDYKLSIYDFANELRNDYLVLSAAYESGIIKFLQFVEILISDLGSFFIFFAFLILYFPEKNFNELIKKGLWWIVAFVVGTSVIHYCMVHLTNSSDEVYRIIKLFSGIVSALAMSLLVARFESTRMQSPLVLLIILYLYAIIQSVFGLFGIAIASYHYFADDFAYTIAALGKTILYLYILWIYATKRIFRYFLDKLIDYNQNKELDAKKNTHSGTAF